jgi:hypothetical protein
VAGKASTTVPSSSIFSSFFAIHASGFRLFQTTGARISASLPLLKLTLTPLQPADRLLALDPAQLALGNKPSLTPNRAQNAAFGDLFSEPLKELLA